MNVSVATSIFAQDNFDPFKTIDYVCRKDDISAVQFYMSPNIQSDFAKIEKIRKTCEENGVKALCHSSMSLAQAADDSAHCGAMAAIFPVGAEKKCIFHFDETADNDDTIRDCEKLLDLGITPCIENFYIDKTRHGLVANIEKYLSLFDRIAVKNVAVLPVIDFPRLFVEQFINFHPILLSELLIQKFAKQRILIHAIDTRSARQEREDWCAVGRGIVGWIDIFEYLKKQNVFVEYAVLEYENTDFIDESVAHLNKYKSM